MYATEDKYIIIRALSNIDSLNIIDEIRLDEVQQIYDYAFFNSNVAKKLTIGKTLAGYGLGKGAFHSGKFIEIDLSEANSLIYIDDYTFYEMTKLEKVLLPQKGSLSKFGTNVFYNSLKLQELIIPEGVIYFNVSKNSSVSDFITKCGIRTFTVPSNVLKLPKGFINDCPYLEEFDFSAYCVLDTTEQIVTNCPLLKKIKLPIFSLTVNENKYFLLKNGNVVAGPYYDGNDAIIQLNLLTAKEESANVPDAEKGKFSTEIYNVGDTINVNNRFYANGKSNAFDTCYGIEFFEFNELDNKKTMFISNNGVDGCEEHDSAITQGHTVIRLTEGGDKYLVKLANKCDNYTTPDDIIGYDDGAFANTNLEEITLKNVTYLSNGLFAYTKNLQTIVLPDSVETINDFAFYNSGIETLTLSNTIYEIQQGAFSNCLSLKTIDLPMSLRLLGKNNNGDFGSGVFEKCEMLTELILPKSLNEISQRLCFGCKNLEKLEILTENLIDIGKFAFCNCVKLGDIRVCSKNISNIQCDNTYPSTDGVGNFHPFGYSKNTYIASGVKTNKYLYVSYGMTSEYSNDTNWRIPLITKCNFNFVELTINDIIFVNHSSLDNYDVIYPKTQSGRYDNVYGIYRNNENKFEIIFNNDASDGEIIYLYSDPEHTNLLCQFTLSYKKTEYNNADYILGSSRKRVLFGTTLFANKQTDSTPVEDEIVNITKSEYNLLLSKIDNLTRLINLKK